MKRVKDISQIIIKPDNILAEIFYENSLIKRPDQAEALFDHGVVLNVGKDIDDIAKGDIILQASGSTVFNVEKDGVKREFILVPRYGIVVAVKPDNFDKTKKKIFNIKDVN